MSIESEFGIGDAVVDLILPREVRQGETVDARVEVFGGSERHEVERIYAALDVVFPSGSEGDPDPTIAIGEQSLLDQGFVVEPIERDDEDEDEDEDEEAGSGSEGSAGGSLATDLGDGDDSEFSFGEVNEADAETESDDGDDEVEPDVFDVTVAIPQAAPVTVPGEGFPTEGMYPTVAVETGLEIDAVLDPEDEDPLDIALGGRFETFHRAVEDHLGFELARVERGRLEGFKNWTQRFEYDPVPGSEFADEYDELEADLDYTHEGAGLGLEVQFDPIDSVPLELGEEYETFVVEHDDPELVARDLRELA